MKKMASAIALISLVVAFSVGCRRTERAYPELVLASGKRVKVISMTQMSFTRGEPALMLKYITNVPMSDVASLTDEADEVWTAFQPTVERANLRSAILSATTPPSGGFVARTSGYNFVFERSGDGSWKRLPSTH